MKEFYVESAKAMVRYHDLPGQGIPVLFLHGLGCAASFDYPRVASAEGVRRHRSILVDLIGSGFSDKPDSFAYSIESHAVYLDELVGHLNLDAFYLFGHSMGGSIAIPLAARREGQIRGIILGEANLDPGGGLFSRKIAAFTEEDYCAFGHELTIKEARETSNGKWAAGLAVSAPVAIHREAVSLVDGGTPSWREVFSALAVPKTSIFGEQSLPDPDVFELERQGVHIEILDNAGHSMAWDNPDGLAGALGKAMDRSESGTL